MPILARVALSFALLTLAAAAFWGLVPLADRLLMALVLGDAIAHSGSTGQEARAAISNHLPTFSVIGSLLVRIGTGVLFGIALTSILVLLQINLRRSWWLILVGAAIALAIPTARIVSIHTSIFGGDSAYLFES